jgi:hypothetical protein
MARRFDSPKNWYHLFCILVRVTWVLVAGTAVFAFLQNVRSGFVVLLVGFSILIVLLLARDYLSRRLEQRRKPYRIKYAPGEAPAPTAEMETADES